MSVMDNSSYLFAELVVQPCARSSSSPPGPGYSPSSLNINHLQRFLAIYFVDFLDQDFENIAKNT